MNVQNLPEVTDEELLSIQLLVELITLSFLLLLFALYLDKHGKNPSRSYSSKTFIKPIYAAILEAWKGIAHY